MLKLPYHRNGGSTVTNFSNNSDPFGDRYEPPEWDDVHQDELEEDVEPDCVDCPDLATEMDNGELVCSSCGEERRLARRIKPPETYSPEFYEQLCQPFASPEALLAAKAIKALGRDATEVAIALAIDAAIKVRTG